MNAILGASVHVALVALLIATAADSRLPLHCSAQADPQCVALGDVGVYDEARLLHEATSTTAATAAAVSMIAFLLAAYQFGWPLWLRATGSASVVTYIVCTAWTLWAVNTDEHGDESWFLGAAQRLQRLAVSGWIGHLALITGRQRPLEPWVRRCVVTDVCCSETFLFHTPARHSAGHGIRTRNSGSSTADACAHMYGATRPGGTAPQPLATNE